MWFNKIMLTLLGSPIHGIMSGSNMGLTYTGHKSGKTYATPVEYVRELTADGEVRLWTLSQRSDTWWRNLRGGERVTLNIKRQTVPATGHLIEEHDAVEEALVRYLELAPRVARLIHVPMQDGTPDAEGLKAAAQMMLLVYFTPETPETPVGPGNQS